MRTLRYLLAASLVGGATSLGAVHLSDGEGQALIYPYYTVNGDLNTLIQVSNLQDSVKALKIRFHEGSNGRAVLSFSIYLRPYDTWTAALYAESEDGPARLRTFDPTCTVPSIPAGGVDFRNFDYTDTNADGGSGGFARTREGHIEIFEMGEVSGNLATAADLYQCQSLIAAWSPGGTWNMDATAQIEPPAGGLIGAAAVVDPPEGQIYSYRAVALGAFSGIAQHRDPGGPEPNLSTAAASSEEADVVATWITSDGVAHTASWPRAQAVDAVSAVLARVEVSTRYTQEQALLAESEWVLNFPTKRFYTDTANGGVLDGDPLPPFDVAFSGDEPRTRPPVAGGACTFHFLRVRDREGVLQHPDHAEACFSEAKLNCPPNILATCQAVQVVSLGHAALDLDASPLLGSQRLALYQNGHPGNPPVFPQVVNLTPAEDIAGYAALSLVDWTPAALRPSLEGVVPQGLPVIALGFKRLTHQNAQPGVLANYGAVLPHSSLSEATVGAE